jgi:hypothetical protein
MDDLTERARSSTLGDEAQKAVSREVLGPGEQLTRDARLRLLAASAVVLVHSAYPPGHAVLAGLGPGARTVEAVLFRLAVSFPVNAFILLAFMSLAPRLQAGRSALQLLRGPARRLVPIQIFWSLAFLAAHAAASRDLPGPGTVLRGVVLGQAAAHLYFIPQLLALMAAAPLFFRLSQTPLVALASGAALSAASAGLYLAVGGANTWIHAISGLLGFGPFAIAGLAMARAWGGVAPGPERSRGVIRVGIALAMVSGLVLVQTILEARGGPTRFSAHGWLANIGFALAVPVLLLAWRARLPPKLLRLAPYTLGVYLIHPFFIQGLRAAESQLHWLSGGEVALILPNAVLAGAMSLGAVVLLARSPLRRTVL